MIRAIISDFSRVLIFPKNEDYKGSLNELHRNLSVTENYNLSHHFQLNTELIEYFQTIRSKYDLFIFTTETLHEEKELQSIINDIFTKIYSALRMGWSKKEPKAYLAIADDLNLSPDELLFIDDTKGNTDAAHEAGLHTIHYISNQQLFAELKSYLENI